MSDKYNSKIAKFIGKLNGVLPPKGYAITISEDTTLYSVSKEEAEQKPDWIAEEEYHQKQFYKRGWIPFVGYYFWEMIWRGYKKNRLEIEAKKATGRL